LEEKVAELVQQLLVVAGERGVRYLIGLLDRVRDDARRRLLPIPRTVPAQALGQVLQVEESRGGLGAGLAGGRAAGVPREAPALGGRHLSRSSSRAPSAS